MNRSTRRLISYSALALGMSVLACGGDDGTSSSGGGGTGNVGAKGGTGGGGTGGVGNTGGGGTGGGGTGGVGNTGGGGTGGGGTGGVGNTGGGGTGGGTGTDADGDGYDDTKDCDDNDKDVHPGATELCNGIDDNCDNQIDEGVSSTFYVDADGDAFGVDNAATNKSGCTPPTGYATAKGDCDDKDATSYPGNTEICDGKDNDCNGQIDDGVTKNTYYPDNDGDGFGTGSGTQACVAPGANYVLQGGDCNDNDNTMFPGNPEVCDGKDNDCNAATPDPGSQTWYQDNDGDGYGNQSVTKVACAQPAGYVAASPVFDCNDNDKTINPQAIELCDGKDNNCINGIDEGSTATWPDADGDGYGDSKGTVSYLCNVPAGRADNNLDCNDGNKNINPNATEIPGNGIDENCDGKDTAAGTLCGYKSFSVTTLPSVNSSSLGQADDQSANGPMGAGFWWEDWEVSVNAGQTFTAFMASRSNSAVEPRLGRRGPNTCAGTWVMSSSITNGNPNGYVHSASLVTNATAGYYYFGATTRLAGQTGAYNFDVFPGNVGGSCGDETFRLYPLGARLVTWMNAAGGTHPLPAGYVGDDIETYLSANTTYTALMGGSPNIAVDRIYVAKEGACGTSLGSSTSGILNGGARLIFTPTSSGVYSFWAAGALSSYVGENYNYNVVPGNVGESCFAGAFVGTGTNNQPGDSYVLWPLGGTVNGTLELTDRNGDYGTTFVSDDYETWLEPGETITVNVVRQAGGTAYTPKVRLMRYTGTAASCTTVVAQSVQTTGNTGSFTYTVPNGIIHGSIYVITVTSTTGNNIGPYTLQTSY